MSPLLEEQAHVVQPAAIILGFDCITGLLMARSLNSHGVSVSGVVSDAKHFAAHSRCVERIDTIELDASDLVPRLVALAGAQRPVLMPATDAAVDVIVRNAKALEPYFRIARLAEAAIQRALGKVPFAVHVQQAGLPAPPTRIVEKASDLQAAATELHPPFVLKPNLKTRRWDQAIGMKVVRADNRDALNRAYERCHGYSESFVVQEWIEGGDDAMYSYYAYVTDDGRIAAEAVAHKLRQWPRLIGSGSLCELCVEPDVVALGRALLESLGHRGYATVQVKRDPHGGKPLLVEINVGRPGMNMFVCEAGGLEMTWLAYCSVAGRPLPEMRSPRTGARFVSLKRDLAAAFVGWRSGELGLLDYLRSLRGVRLTAVFDLRDPLPFLYDVLRVTSQLRRREPESRRGQQ